MKKLICASALVLSLAACAQHPDKIAASYVSPMEYQNFSCKQIGAELSRVSRKANELYYRVDKTASDDSAQMGIGLVLFWPALFFLDGKGGPEAAEYARLKGEADALEQASIRKNCGFRIESMPKPKTTTTTTKKKSGFKE